MANGGEKLTGILAADPPPGTAEEKPGKFPRSD
jgi:hypothetical protein